MKMNTIAKKTKGLLLASTFAAISVFSTSCGGEASGSANLEIPGVDGPTLTLLDDNLLINMVLENVQLQGGLRAAIPEYDNSFIEISPDLQSNGTLLAVNISLTDLFDDRLQLQDPQALPGGRPLPGVVGGRLPAVAFTLQTLKNMTFYVGPQFFGIFVPINLDIGVNNIVTARYFVEGRGAGTLSIVGPDADADNSGFLLLLDLSNTVKRGLQKIADI